MKGWKRGLCLLMSLAAAAGAAGAGQPSQPSAATDCQEAGSDDGVVQGRLGLFEGMGPAAFIVTVPQGLCLKGADQRDTVADARSVQLFAATAEGFQDLYRLAGQRVYVRGRLSGLRSFQQKAPVIMEVIEIATQ